MSKRIAIGRNLTLLRAAEFQAEPQNLPFAVELTYFHRITRNLTYINRSAFHQPGQQAHMDVCAVINAVQMAL